ncbi:MAG: hypothetical protein QW478_07775 [Candidatus Micrarchaeaceae archaeon]
MADERSDMFKWALSGEDIIVNYEHILQGEMIKTEIRTEVLPDGSQSQYPVMSWQKVSEPLMNAEGIQSITSTLYSFLNRSVFLSNLSEMKAMQLARNILLVVNRKILLRVKQFNISPENYEEVMSKLETLLIPSLLRAQDEGERKFFAKTTTELRQVLERPPQGQGGGLLPVYQQR